MSGHIYSWTASIDHLEVIDIKESLARHVNTPAARQALLYKDTLLDDSRRLDAYVPADELRAAESEGFPVQLNLLKVATTSIIVPDDCRTISEAVARLSTCGGVVEVVAPPTVARDVIEIRRPDISIIAAGQGGVDARRARIYIKIESQAYWNAASLLGNRTHAPAHHVCIQGLQNLGHIGILECSHVGSIAFRDCDLLLYREMHVRFHPWFKTPYEAIDRRQVALGFNRPSTKYQKRRRGSTACRTLFTAFQLRLDVHSDHVTPIPWPSNCAPQQESFPQIKPVKPLRIRMLEKSYAEACRGL
jgi:hypothetical protein